MDVLRKMMIKVEESCVSNGLIVGRDKTRVTLLQFADDIIFFYNSSLENLQILELILLVFR